MLTPKPAQAGPELSAGTHVLSGTPVLTERSPAEVDARRRRRYGDESVFLAATIIGVGALVALACTVGADARWLAALGRVIAERGEVPHGVPFATAASASWPNVIVLAELIFHGLEGAFGDRGLMLAEVLAVTAGLTLIARDSLSGGASASGTSVALLLASIGAFTSFAVVRVQLFSLVLFPALLALLRHDARRPSRQVWMCAPLLILWSNLHGAALTGLAITLIYLALVRLRQDPATAVGVGLLAFISVCITPAGLRTIAYYRGVLTNVAAQRGEGLWAPLTFRAPFDVVSVVVVIVLVIWALYGWRGRPPVWEFVSIIALAGLTVDASRSTVWLLLFLVGPAARGLSVGPIRRSVSVIVAALAAIVIPFSIARGPLPNGARAPLLARAIAIAHGTPVLASDVIAEQIALAGGRVWLSNPIDAFKKSSQATYLDWVEGRPSGRRALLADVNVVLVDRATPADELMARTPGFVVVQSDAKVRLYERAG
jgi:hypothetical protein